LDIELSPELTGIGLVSLGNISNDDRHCVAEHFSTELLFSFNYPQLDELTLASDTRDKLAFSRHSTC
jgi:hypothetical protein